MNCFWWRMKQETLAQGPLCEPKVSFLQCCQFKFRISSQTGHFDGFSGSVLNGPMGVGNDCFDPLMRMEKYPRALIPPKVKMGAAQMILSIAVRSESFYIESHIWIIFRFRVRVGLGIKLGPSQTKMHFTNG